MINSQILFTAEHYSQKNLLSQHITYNRKGVSLPDPSSESMGQPAHSNEGEERTEYCHLKNFEGAILK